MDKSFREEINKNAKFCKKCIMNDIVDKYISFDKNGVCNHCLRYQELKNIRLVTGKDTQIKLNKLINKIKKKGINSEYDCVIGVSGGVDSTYVAYLVKEFGLRPLAIHVDNGWNSELAVKNIENTLKNCGIDLYTKVLNWFEFRDLQKSFLYSSSPYGEIPTDHAINAILWNEAAKRNIKFIITGMNFASESIETFYWSYGHADWKFIKNIHKKFGNMKLKKYPHFTPLQLFYFTFFKGIRNISILNYIRYNKNEVKSILIKKLNWRPYQAKHYESTYTRFFQGYYLPKKFKIDKKYGHLSDLINSKIINREEALKILNEEDYSLNDQNSDIEYVCKKLDLSQEEFQKIVHMPNKFFMDYENSYNIIQFLKNTVNYLRKKGLYPK